MPAVSGSSGIVYSDQSLAPRPYSLLPDSPSTLPLRLPLTFWAAPPEHHITAIAASAPTAASPTRYLYTGSTAGHVIQWEPLSSRHPAASPASSSSASSSSSAPSPLSFRPRLFSYHRGATSITALCCVPYLSSSLLCAGTSCGFLSVWHGGGECLSSSFLLPFMPTALLPFQSVASFSSTSYLLASSSCHPYVYVWSLPGMETVMIIGHEKDSTGVVGMCLTCRRARRPTPGKDGVDSASAVEDREMLLTVSASGVVAVWDLHNKLQRNRDKRQPIPFFSFSTFQSGLLSASPSSSLSPLAVAVASEQLLLVLTRDHLCIVSAASLSVLCMLHVAEQVRRGGAGGGGELQLTEEDELISLQVSASSGGLSSFRVVLTTVTALVLLLTLSCQYERRKRKEGRAEERAEATLTLDAVIRLDDNRRGRQSSPFSPSNGALSPSSSAVLLPASAASCVQVLDDHVVVGHAAGELSVYALLPPPAVGSATLLTPCFYTCVPFAFPALSLSSLSAPAVSCSHLHLSLTSPFLHHCIGYSDGQLLITELTSRSSASASSASSSSAFTFSSSAQSDPSDFRVPAHDGAISCMLDVHDRVVHQRMLVTGGSDGFVCIWDVEKKRRRARLYCVSPVLALTQLSIPASSSASSSPSPASYLSFPCISSTASALFYLPSLLFVSCSDRSVRIVSLLSYTAVTTLAGHSSPVTSVSLPSSSSLYCDHLHVLCEDRSVYVWSLSSSHLLAVVRGEDSKQVMNVVEWWLDREPGRERGLRGGGEDSELELATMRAREEVKEKRQRDREGRQGGRKRGSAASSSSAALQTPAFASLSAKYFLLSALSSLASCSPLLLPSLSPVSLPAELQQRQAEFVQLLSVLYPSAPIVMLEREKEAEEEEKERERRERGEERTEREREREAERVETAAERAREAEKARRREEVQLQREGEQAEEAERRRRETGGAELIRPPAFDVINFASRVSASALSSCISIAVFDITALVAALEKSPPQATDKEADAAASASSQAFLRSVLSLFLDCDGKGVVESLMRELGLPASRPSRGFSLLSKDESAVSVLFPSHSYSHRRWQMGEVMSASASLCIAAVCAASSSSSPAYSRLQAYYTSTLLEQPKHCQPSLSFLLSYTLHSCSVIAEAARNLVREWLQRVGVEGAGLVAAEWSGYYDYPLSMDGLWKDRTDDDDEKSSTSGSADGGRQAKDGRREDREDAVQVTDAEVMVALLMTFIGVMEINAKRRRKKRQSLFPQHEQPQQHRSASPSSSPSSLTEFEAKSQYITHTLLRVIARPVREFPSAVAAQNAQLCGLACDLLCSALPFLRIHIASPLPFLRHLLHLSSTPSTSPALAASASKLLLECGRLAPSFFIECMGREALAAHNAPQLRQSAIAAFTQLMKRHPLSLARMLPSAVMTIIRCLDPAAPQVRKTLLSSTTAALYALVTSYPSCSFHRQSQRFAVGAAAGVIVVYDVRTATVWRVLESGQQTEEVHAVLFSSSEEGERLISYSAWGGDGGGGLVRVWNTGVGGWLGGLIGMSGKCVRAVRLERVELDSLLKKEREERREQERQTMEEERRDDRKREDRRRKKQLRQQLHASEPQPNGSDSPSSSSPRAAAAMANARRDSLPSLSLSTTPVLSANRRLPPPPVLSGPASSSSSPSNGRGVETGLPPSPLLLPLPPPPLSLVIEDDEEQEEVEGMGPSIGIATYHALPGNPLASGPLLSPGSSAAAAAAGGPTVKGGAAGTGAGPAAAGGAGSSSLVVLKHLLAVKLSWTNGERGVRLVREDGSVKEVGV